MYISSMKIYTSLIILGIIMNCLDSAVDLVLTVPSCVIFPLIGYATASLYKPGIKIQLL